MDRRKVVLEIVKKNPGIRFNEIMRISNIKNGTLSHYVKKLEDEKSIDKIAIEPIIATRNIEYFFH